MADIFLSYARADQPKIERLAAALEKAGYSVWWDRHLEGGGQYSKDIEKQLESARAVIVAWSAQSVESEWVRDEAALARDANKLVPIGLDGTLPPIGFRQRQAIDFSVRADQPAALASLKAVLDKLVGGEHGTIASAPAQGKRSRLALLLLPLLLLLAIGGWAIWQSMGTSGPAASEDSDTRKSVAVLPFVAQSTTDDDQYFADGVTEEVLNRLDALDELRVLPRTTVFSLRDNKDALDVLAQKLGVDYVVEGSLRRGGDDIRVTARLTRTADGETLWSNSYDGKAADILEFQSDIAEKVAGSLDVLLDDRKRIMMQDVGVDDPETFAIYAKARDMFDKGHEDLTDLALLYQSSLLLDAASAQSPKLWTAAIESSDFYSHLLLDAAAGIPHPEVPAEAQRDPQKEMLDRLAAARLGTTSRTEQLEIDIYAAAFSDDWSSIPAMAREYYPDHRGCGFPNWNSFLLTAIGQLDDMADAYLRAEQCRAGDFSFAWFAVEFLVRADRIDDARGVLARERERGLLPKGILDALDSRIELFAGNLDKAVALGRDSISRLNLVAALAAKNSPDAIEELERGLDAGMVPIWDHIAALAVTGQRDRINALASAIDARPGGPTALQIGVDVCACGAPFDIDQTPNYAAVLKRSKLPWPMPNSRKWPMKDW